MMEELHRALADVDVLVVPYRDGREALGERPRRQSAPTAATERARRSEAQPRRSSASRFFQFANAACYPAVAVRNGFGDDGLPTGITFVGKPFHESEVLLAAWAYQDATDYHRRVPSLEGA